MRTVVIRTDCRRLPSQTVPGVVHSSDHHSSGGCHAALTSILGCPSAQPTDRSGVATATRRAHGPTEI